MKTFLVLFFLFFCLAIHAQQEDNVFQKSEDQTTGVSSKNEGVDSRIQADPWPSNPGDDDEVPIDNYLPVLIIAGVSLVVYQYKTRKRTIQ